ncbi:trehalose utilization protein [Geomicrobium halophilum]|uniref:Trehalose utilization protein n=1 Tax=Geomicrobium halophilum TaxID=549000 RepID=A0A841Q1V0_9BACL|nr:ThuA domain-containing protein [Geomicrobium halophilum]MBB6450028.1 trehalose utilization protein [Geomicrobium halophilum]
MNITIWNENCHEQQNPKAANIYPEGIHGQLAAVLIESGYTDVKTATLDEPEHGLSKDVLDSTDVLLWWGHIAHDEVDDEVVDRVAERVLKGMGLIVLHSGHHSKIFRKLMGTTCNLKWREADEKERLWVIDPSHPICSGIGQYIELEREEMYGEHFDIPEPDRLLFVSWFEGGEVFRSGCTYQRGRGKIFYFRPGHETYPSYYHPDIQKVIENGVSWAAPVHTAWQQYGNVEPLETILEKE